MTGAADKHCERNARHYADEREAQAVAQNHPHHLAAARAHGHAHADFGGAAVDAIGQRSVEARSDEHDGEQAEESARRANMSWLEIVVSYWAR